MARTNYTTDDLLKLGLVKDKDGNWHKPKTIQQPRDIEKSIKKESVYIGFNSGRYIGESPIPLPKDYVRTSDIKIFRTLTLNLFGIPMPKQSVRSTNTGHHYQPQKTVDRKKDYIRQIKEQLPKGWIPFEHEVHVTKFHCIYPPLKSFHKIKGRMDAIRNGEIFYKNTQPDLIDNLKKLNFDSMSGIVFKNDGLIVTENNTAKYYGIGGCIIIELKGH